MDNDGYEIQGVIRYNVNLGIRVVTTFVNSTCTREEVAYIGEGKVNDVQIAHMRVL